MNGRPDIESLVSLLESAPDPALITDDQDRIVLVNHSAESLFGYWRLELAGRSIHDFVPHRQEIVGDRTSIVARHQDGHAMRLTVSFRSIPVDRQLLTAGYFRNQDDGSAPDVIRTRPPAGRDVPVRRHRPTALRERRRGRRARDPGGDIHGEDADGVRAAVAVGPDVARGIREVLERRVAATRLAD